VNKMNRHDNKILILRTRNCRKSNLIIDFLDKEGIPHEVKSLPDDLEAQKLAKDFNILSSPGIIVNGKVVNPYQLIENCRIKDANGAKKMLKELLEAESNNV